MNKAKNWVEVGRKLVYDQFFNKVEKVFFKLPNGENHEVYIHNERQTVCILALTSNKEVILTRQFRPGPKQILNELPGGFIDDNEDPMLAASRELKEETGYDGQIEFIGNCWDSAYSTMNRSCFVATNCRKVVSPVNDKKEPIEVILVSLDDFRTQIRSGQATDVEVGYLGLDYLNLL